MLTQIKVNITLPVDIYISTVDALNANALKLLLEILRKAEFIYFMSFTKKIRFI